MKKKVLFACGVLFFCFALGGVSFGTDTGVSAGGEDSGAIYKPGEYEGKGQGRWGEMTIKVTVDENRILAIEVLDNKETPKKLEKAKGPVIEQILKTQQTKVDVVAKSSKSSEGIMEGTEKALEQARIK